MADFWSHPSTTTRPVVSPSARATAIAVGPLGERIACGHESGFDFYEPLTGERAQGSPALSAAVLSLAFSPDGTRVATGCEDGRIFIFDAATLNTLLEFQAHEPRGPHAYQYVSALAWTPGGGRLISASGNGRVRVWTTIAPATH